MANLPIRSTQRLEQQRRISKLKRFIQEAIAEINYIDPALTTADNIVSSEWGGSALFGRLLGPSCAGC